MAQPPSSEQTGDEECGERERRDEPDERDHAQPLLNLRLRRETRSGLPASFVAAKPLLTRSAPHLVDLVHVHYRPVAISRQDDPESNGDLGRSDDEDEDDEDAPTLVDRAVLPREGDQSEVRGVEHELDTHEDHDRVAADQHPRAPDEEERHRHDAVRAASGVCRWKNRARGPSLNLVNITPYRIRTVIAPT